MATAWYKTGALLACLLMVPAGAVQAAPPPAAEGTTAAAETTVTAAALTLEQAQALALQTNKAYQTQRERERQARDQWWQSVLAFGPNASLNGAYVLKNKPLTTSFEIPGLGPQEMELATNYYAGQLSITQPLFTGFKLLNALHLTELQYEIARDNSQVTRMQLYLDVTRAFYNVLVTEQLLKVTKASLDSMQQHLEIARARYREGSASNYEVLRSQVQVANMQPNLLKLNTALSLARSSLAILTGLDLKQPLQLSGSLKTVAEQWPALEELESQALSRRLEVKNLERTKRMAEIGRTLAATGNLPNLALAGSWTYYDIVDKNFPPAGENLKHSWQIALSLNWPFWDNLAAIPKSDQAASKVQEAELGAQALADGIRLDVESSYLAMTAAQQTIEAQSQTAALAKESYRLAENQYRNGMATNIDVMDAQIALNQAEINDLQAQFDFLVASVKLHQAVGDNY